MRHSILRKKYLIAGILLIWANFCTAEYLESQPLPTPGWPGHDLTGAPCQNLGQAYGPYDYTNPHHRGYNLNIVENAHFTRKVEMLISGTTSSRPWKDLQYTIKAFPNHHRALYAMARYELRNPSLRSWKSHPAPAECYYQRAIKFKPDDYRVMQLYANYLVKKKQPQMAIDIYKRAAKIKDVPPEINYYLGLLLFDTKKFNEAAEQAKLADDGGFKKSNLIQKLKKVGHWPAP